MKVILLCAGYATRLYPLTKDTPKSLLPIGGRPILEWIFGWLGELSNVEGIYIVSNRRFASKFEDWVNDSNHLSSLHKSSSSSPRIKNSSFPHDFRRESKSSDPRLTPCGDDERKGRGNDTPIKIIDDGTTSNKDRLGAIGDLNFVIQKEKLRKDDLLVIAGDNFFDGGIKSFHKNASKHDASPVLGVYDVKDRNLARQYGIVSRDEKGKVTGFYEKPQDPPSTLASCGIYWLPAKTSVLLDRYLASGNNPDQPGHYMSWLATNTSLYAVSLEGSWVDIGDRVSYDQVNQKYQGTTS